MKQPSAHETNLFELGQVERKGKAYQDVDGRDKRKPRSVMADAVITYERAPETRVVAETILIPFDIGIQSWVLVERRVNGAFTVLGWGSRETPVQRPEFGGICFIEARQNDWHEN
ncbi:hypothetical protein N7493_007358 [Penicillium malachiteum]|uniref:Uncharacterized protein n=1 Tax=Penicillium malachiteum TaxID=1324776 RepID=A0AAD6HJA8_9EURO|nr:hypothetical protein N7493_007358 [Penicillium malachiteum]